MLVFVQFFDDNQEVTYYATYTAYNGFYNSSTVD